MPWNPIDPAIPGEVISAAYWNEQVGENLTHLRTQGLALAGQTAEDLIYANSPTTFGRLAATALATPCWNPSGVLTYLGALALRDNAFPTLNSFISGGPIGAEQYRLQQMAPTPGYVPRFNVAGSAWENFRVVGFHELYIPATAFQPRHTTPCGWHTTIANANGGAFVTLPFGTSSYQDAAIVISLPKAWNEATSVFWQVYYTFASGTGNVQWQIYMASVGHGETVSFSSNAGTTPQTPGAPTLLYLAPSSSITPSGPPQPGDLMEILIRRYRDGVNDTFSDTVNFVGVKLYLTTDQLTDD